VDVNGEAMLFPDRLWARVVYDHAAAYNFGCESEREDVLESLLSLFLGRTAGFIGLAGTMSDSEVDEIVLASAKAFAAEKPYLKERWMARAAALSR
jgi:hypothetical protein